VRRSALEAVLQHCSLLRIYPHRACTVCRRSLFRSNTARRVLHCIFPVENHGRCEYMDYEVSLFVPIRILEVSVSVQLESCSG